MQDDDDNGRLHGLLGQTKPMPTSRDWVLYCSPKKRECGVDRTGHTDQPHNVARATVSDLFTAGASLACKPQQASSWLLKLGLIPVCANSEGGGSHGTEASDRWKYRCWAPQVVAITQSDRSGPSRWDSVCTCCWRGQKRQGACQLLGLHQLLQALQHCQTQGLELHGQFDNFSFLLFL